MGTGCDRPGHGLHRDVAHVHQCQTALGKSQVEVVQHRSGAHGHGVAIDAQQPRQALGSQQHTVGCHQRGE
jgi:hypothetical protein